MNDQLLKAASDGNRDLAELLLDQGANIDESDGHGRTVLARAVRWGRLDVVELLLDRCVKMDLADVEGATPLILAVYEDCGDMVKLLLDKGADIDAGGGDGRGSALDVAVNIEKRGLVELLLDRGATIDFTKRSSRRTTVLFDAKAIGNIFITYLIQDEILKRENQNRHDVGRFTKSAAGRLTIALYK